ncbi:hypothetical protein [Bradyrhizobium sp. 153]|uniref:hypothetical protein n=1 Tax=Bradyrhizobium sp. 153 TaxID=2782627 RepID=UPI001FFB47EA|nr:hypothetical protein [Bradyrhizobium sp. 153]MCK1668652.1 hypothetical protein [Bradyrhizobium sp. 153]
MAAPLLINCQHGLGDNIYSRPFVRAASARGPVYLATPWPELFEDLPVQFVEPGTRLRTQAKNVALQQRGRWVRPPAQARSVRVSYGAVQFRNGINIARSIESALPLRGAPFVFDLPPTGDAPITARKPVAFVRPATVRREWFNSARNPKPEYIAAIAAELMTTHHVVVVADLEDGVEWAEGQLPPHHQAFLRGELPVRSLLALLAAAEVVVGGVGWIVPASLALRRSAFIVLGGHGGHNAPALITDPRMDLSKIYFAHPTEYCRCTDMKHNCTKEIPDLLLKWDTFRHKRFRPF